MKRILIIVLFLSASPLISCADIKSNSILLADPNDSTHKITAHYYFDGKHTSHCKQPLPNINQTHWGTVFVIPGALGESFEDSAQHLLAISKAVGKACIRFIGITLENGNGYWDINSNNRKRIGFEKTAQFILAAIHQAQTSPQLQITKGTNFVLLAGSAGGLIAAAGIEWDINLLAYSVNKSFRQHLKRVILVSPPISNSLETSCNDAASGSTIHAYFEYITNQTLETSELCPPPKPEHELLNLNHSNPLDPGPFRNYLRTGPTLAILAGTQDRTYGEGVNYSKLMLYNIGKYIEEITGDELLGDEPNELQQNELPHFRNATFLIDFNSTSADIISTQVQPVVTIVNGANHENIWKFTKTKQVICKNIVSGIIPNTYQNYDICMGF